MILNDLLQVMDSNEIGAIQYNKGEYRFKRESNDVFYYDFNEDEITKIYESKRELLYYLKDKKISCIVCADKYTINISIKD